MKTRYSLLALLFGCTALPVMADEVNVYSHRQPELIQPLLDAFTAETGIAVNVAFVDKGMVERLVAEGDRSPADLVLTVDIARLTQVVDAGVTQAVQSAVLTAAIPPQFRDAGNQWFGLTTRSRVVYASKERVKVGEVTTYEDLADPKWKGRICTTYYIGQMLADPEQKAAAETVNVVFPTFAKGGGSHMNISGVAMTKAAPNHDAALKLMEFLVSDEAQKIYAETNFEFPVKAGVPVSALVASWGAFTPDTLPLADVAAQRPAALKLMEDVDFDG